jgi:hypothetical protein
MDLFSSPLVMVGVFATACYILTLVTRRSVETARPWWAKPGPGLKYPTAWAKWWNEVLLHAVAPAYGVMLALALKPTELVPEMFNTDVSAAVFGLVSGFMSGFCFRLFKRILALKAGVAYDDVKDK